MTEDQKTHARDIIRYVEEKLNRMSYLMGDEEDPNGEIEQDESLTIEGVIQQEYSPLIEKVAEMIQNAPSNDDAADDDKEDKMNLPKFGE